MYLFNFILESFHHPNIIITIASSAIWLLIKNIYAPGKYKIRTPRSTYANAERYLRPYIRNCTVMYDTETERGEITGKKTHRWRKIENDEKRTTMLVVEITSEWLRWCETKKRVPFGCWLETSFTEWNIMSVNFMHFFPPDDIFSPDLLPFHYFIYERSLLREFPFYSMGQNMA